MALQWGIIGAGGIARAFAAGVAHSQQGKMLAVGSRSLEKAQTFAQNNGIPRAYGSYEELLADREVQAVYVATPHPEHAPWAIRAAEAGKHILCEKPLTLNLAESMAVIEAAQAHGVFLMEAYMYRCHPMTQKIAELIRQGAVGDVRVIQAAFAFGGGTINPAGRLFANDLGGGGILDVGGYPVSLARLLAGAALGQPFADPVSVKGSGFLIPETGIDGYASAVLQFPGGILAEVATGVWLTRDNRLMVFGSKGRLEVAMPWFGTGREGGKGSIVVERYAEKTKENIEVVCADWLYALEADAVAEAVAAGQRECRYMSIADSLGNMRTLDAWREQVGLTYEREKTTAACPTVSRRPLARKSEAVVPSGRIAGLDKPVSRLVMGVDKGFTVPQAAVLFDAYFEDGGNTFDTAFIYGGGRCEQTLADWIHGRGVRNQVNTLLKGAHTPDCNPEALRRQLLISLERTKLEYTDLYCMHRDNPAVPVGEFVDVLNQLCGEGRIKVFGGSNWSPERVDAANAYARARGLRGFSLVSNNFSLARMVNPVWDGCIASSDPALREWHRRTQMPLLAWSSQARGFFTERAGRDKLADKSLAYSWYSDDNFARRERAYRLAAEKGVEPINVALAYVLAQDFPVYPLVGPFTLREWKSTLGAFTLTLTPAEVRWLDSGERA